jgi:hypothetical protein
MALATLAAARAFRNSYCALAHGSVLADEVFDPATVTAITKDARETHLEPGERAMMAFVEGMVLNADRVTLARCFFSKLLDALGVQADSMFNDFDPTMREALDGREAD